MKSSIHLLYGIIIGILIVVCTISLTDFNEEKIVYLKYDKENEDIKNLKADGWTIIDLEMNSGGRHYVLVGR